MKSCQKNNYPKIITESQQVTGGFTPITTKWFPFSTIREFPCYEFKSSGSRGLRNCQITNTEYCWWDQYPKNHLFFVKIFLNFFWQFFLNWSVVIHCKLWLLEWHCMHAIPLLSRHNTGLRSHPKNLALVPIVWEQTTKHASKYLVGKSPMQLTFSATEWIDLIACYNFLG